MKRVFIIHGWMGSSDEPRYIKLKSQLEEKEFEVEVLDMPDTENPKMEPWVSYLEKRVGNPDENTYFVGNSIGCQTILRYLEKLLENTKVGGAVFSAGWFTLKGMEEEEGAEEIARPWLGSPLDFGKILTHTNKFTAIFSDNDPYVPLDNKEMFEEKLQAKVSVEHDKDHFPGYDNDAVLNAVLEMAE